MFKHQILFPTGLLFLFVFVAVSCGGEKTKETVVVQGEPDNPNPNPIPGPGPSPGDPGCENGRVTAFVDIQRILTDKCADCHPGYDSFANASNQAKFGGYLNRISLPANNVRRMPKIPNPEFSVGEKNLFQAFASDGYNREKVCRGGGGGVFGLKDVHDIERAFEADLDSLNSAVGELNSRWLLSTHKRNAEQSIGRLRNFKKGIDKAVNFLQDVNEDDILLTTASDQEETIFRIDLDAYGLTADDWALVVSRNKFNFVSRTRRGKRIRDRTGTDVPWMHADNFINIALGDPEVYNVLRDVPLNLNTLLDELDVDVAGGFSGDFTARMMGFNGSRIGEQNRLGLRLDQDSTNGGYWQSFDVDDNFLADKNLFKFPLLVVGQNRFRFDASEIIFSLSNGLMGFALYNADGVRQVAAPTNIVEDDENPFDSEIENGMDCMRCHRDGLLPMRDQIRNSVFENANEFDVDDVEFVRALYRTNDTNSALINTDNVDYRQALSKLNISVGSLDPTNEFVDDFKRQWTLEDTAGLVATMGTKTPGIGYKDDFCNRLNLARGDLGVLCSSPTAIVTKQQVEESFPDLVIDFRLGLDPIDQ